MGALSDSTQAADAPFGLLGRKLGHSYSPAIHGELAGIPYRLIELEPHELGSFLQQTGWQGLNVTVPYKHAVVPFLDELTPTAQRLGNVNTIVRRADGTLLGDNTDFAGFHALVAALGVDVAGKRALVLGGSGGAGTTCRAVLCDLGADVVSVGRSGPVTYDDLPHYSNAALLVNATPLGMYPNCPEAPCTLDALPDLEGVIDLIYNPARTALIIEAEQRGMPAVNGMLMLVAQAAEADRLFTGESISKDRIQATTEALSRLEQNVALIGMPGAGKTRVGRELARLTGRQHVDIDVELERQLGTTCSDFIIEQGEEAFRVQETHALADIAKASRLVISCGGGVVTRPENYALLHQNSRIVMLDRPLEELSSRGRPLSAQNGVQALAEQRMPLYRSWADRIITSRASASLTAQAVLQELQLDVRLRGEAGELEA